MAFRKSSFSAVNNCVEVDTDFDALEWHKAEDSNPTGNRVETATMTDGCVVVRDTKNRDGGTLVFNRDEWRAFIAGVRNGEFDV